MNGRRAHRRRRALDLARDFHTSEVRLLLTPWRKKFCREKGQQALKIEKEKSFPTTRKNVNRFCCGSVLYKSLREHTASNIFFKLKIKTEKFSLASASHSVKTKKNEKILCAWCRSVFDWTIVSEQTENVSRSFETRKRVWSETKGRDWAAPSGLKGVN